VTCALGQAVGLDLFQLHMHSVIAYFVPYQQDHCQKVFNWGTSCLCKGFDQGSQTRSPRAACGLRGPFVRPAMLFGNFQIISVAKCFEKRCHEIMESNLNDAQCCFHPGRGNTDQISLFSKILRNLGQFFLRKMLGTLYGPVGTRFLSFVGPMIMFSD